ncbi:hypothetical protein LSTR_LSTR001684 [Laodelphax striatellus]|uniref:C2H2-type domain-containing protein n=1 Tax=Laodelphax striatellus TaxID=195883 RepID=A0A482XCK0_LAOST|nr:hypothetical protein LSTR_LSTR001684 [Laodelphax striatellus]
MPRRKGHGIPPTKRIKAEQNVATKTTQKSSKGAEKDGENIQVPSKSEIGKSGVEPQIAPKSVNGNGGGSSSSDAEGGSSNGENNYLHKKFKKIAATATAESNLPITNGVDCVSSNRPKEDETQDESKVISGGRYMCPYCKLACAKPSVLEKHIRAHTNERPYPCVPCGFAFKTKSNLYKHCRSRAHAVKVGEADTDEPGKCQDAAAAGAAAAPELSGSDDDSSIEHHAQAQARLNQASPVTSTGLPPTPTSQQNISVTDFQKKIDDRISKTIYKPKFHTSSLYAENSSQSPVSELSTTAKEGWSSDTPTQTNSLSLKMPPVDRAPLSENSVSSPFTSCSSPSPEFLQRHISKLISDNQAIVETMDPIWPKKFLHRSNSKEASHSPSSPFTSLASDPVLSLKKTDSSEVVQSFTNYSSLSEKISEHHSKLALALLRPSDNLEHNYRTPSPLMQDVCNDQQPLNLTTNSSKLDQTGSSSRKRSYSEGFPYGLTESELPPQSSIKLIKSAAGLSRAVPSELNISLDSNNFNVKYMNNMMSNSVMKDSSFKSNIPTEAHEVVVTDTISSMKSSSNSVSSKSQSPELRYVCQTCNIQCKNAQVLGIHQMYYCKGNDGSMGHDKVLDDDGVQSKSPQKGEGPVMIAPPFPSPGPLLGNTPLVDSYTRPVSEHKIDRKPPFKKIRHDSEGTTYLQIQRTEDKKSRPLLTTLRSLEELSKSPMKNNLHMFGGEVKILDDTSGESKTMRIEPSNRGSQGSSEIILDISSASGYKDKLNNNESGTAKEKTPQIVVNIAKTGFHSGGTIVQVPHKMPSSQETNQQRSSKSGTKDLSSSHVSPPNISNSKYPSSNNLIIPIIPNIITPSLTVAGVASPVQLPLAPFTPIIADKAIINPLTSITGYNPLTLPPAPLLCTTVAAAAVSPSLTPIPAPYTGGIVTILHGGKAIPYVPGMPGPHTLLQTSPALASSPNELPRNNKVIEHSKTEHASSEPQSNDSKNQRTHSAQNSPTSSDGKKVTIPSIKLDSAENQNKALPDAKQSTTTVKIISNRRNTISPTTSSASSVPEKNAEKSEEETSTKNANERRFLRPTSLPLKPGTFTPKKLSTPNCSNVLPLVSPETPRPRKSYGQLYLNGHAYTYLGLKCSTRVFFCTLNKPQPIYVPLTPEHSNISMYSNWKIRSDADPNPFGLEPGQAMAHYDSRHRPTSFTVASTTKFEAVTHSSQWKCRSSTEHSLKTEPANKLDSPEEKDESPKENAPKRIKIFDGGFESNEDYIYVRGRGRGRYVCEVCGIRCKKPSMLKKHIRTHTDVRPFTCKHCNFSFKTKGNLTKHMKSKAHFKKCTELGIDPVPISVDDTQINAELLARQQAMRADRGLDPNLTDEDEDAEEEEEEEEDDEDEDDDDVDVDGDDDDYEDEWNSRLEQDAARSLLSLSKVAASTAAQSSAVRGGLVAPHGRPHTYPYSHPLTATPLSHPHHTTQPQTPTLSAISAQREREKVSQNTGLARVHPDEPPAQVERSEAGVASRYYFPSTRNLQDDKTKTSPDADRNESSSNKETTDSEKNPPPSCPIDLSYKSSDESRARTCEAALLLASLCSTVDALPSTPTPVADVSEDSQLLQAYLTERAVKQQNMKQHQYHRPQVAVLYTGTNSIQTIDSSKASPTEKPPLDGSFTTQDKSKFLSISKAPNFHVESLIRPTPEPVAASHSNPAQDDDESDKESSTKKSEHGHDIADSVDDAPPSDAPPSKKPKAEFIPPSNGPPPNYVSVLEDGRSMCLICNKLFTKPSQLWLHVNIHYFERPFRCESCAVSFRTKGHLQKHQRSVTHMNKMSMNSTFGTATTSNPRPFKCDDCKIAFRIHGHLAKHLRSKMHIMKLECLGKLPFGTYAEMERSGINMNDIDTTDCDNSLESLQLLAQKLIDKDPSKLGQWDPLIQRSMSTGETSSEEEDSPAAILTKSGLHAAAPRGAPAIIHDATFKGPSPKSNELPPTIFNSSTVISNSSDVFALSQHPKTDPLKTVIQRGSQLVYGEPKKSDESGNVLRVSAPIGGSFAGESGLPRPSTANSVLVPSTRNYTQPIGRFTTKLLMNSSQVSERTRDSTVVSAIRSKVETNYEKNCS